MVNPFNMTTFVMVFVVVGVLLFGNLFYLAANEYQSSLDTRNDEIAVLLKENNDLLKRVEVITTKVENFTKHIDKKFTELDEQFKQAANTSSPSLSPSPPTRSQSPSPLPTTLSPSNNTDSGNEIGKPKTYTNEELFGKLPCEKLKKKEIHIKLYKSPNWTPPQFDETVECECGLKCTSNANVDLKTADAYIDIDGSANYNNGKPIKGFPNQISIFFSMEPMHRLSSWERGVAYDARLTFDMDSEIPVTYFDRPSSGFSGRGHSFKDHKEEFVMSFMSSNCETFRQEILSTFQKYFKVHSFGKCGNNANEGQLFPDCQGAWYEKKQCTLSKYKFHLAIENSNQKDYVTEKLWHSWGGRTVPVYFGTESVSNTTQFYPAPHSFIDGNRFGSVEEVAQYVAMIAKNEYLYNEYTKWHSEGTSKEFQKTVAMGMTENILCRICKYIALNIKQ